VAHSLDPYHSCPVCDQPTENLNQCDSCTDQMAFMLKRYEADVRPEREPRKADHNE
jgi:hypothetical protein